jgi:hypothetical protein
MTTCSCVVEKNLKKHNIYNMPMWLLLLLQLGWLFESKTTNEVHFGVVSITRERVGKGEVQNNAYPVEHNLQKEKIQIICRSTGKPPQSLMPSKAGVEQQKKSPQKGTLWQVPNYNFEQKKPSKKGKSRFAVPLWGMLHVLHLAG